MAKNKPTKAPKKRYGGGVALTANEAADLLDALLGFKRIVDWQKSQEWSKVEKQIAALLDADRIPHGSRRRWRA